MEENVEQISINVEKVNKIKSNFPDEDLLFDIAENFKVFGDSTRMKIIAKIIRRRAKCIRDCGNYKFYTIGYFASIKSLETSKTC